MPLSAQAAKRPTRSITAPNVAMRRSTTRAGPSTALRGNSTTTVHGAPVTARAVARTSPAPGRSYSTIPDRACCMSRGGWGPSTRCDRSVHNVPEESVRYSAAPRPINRLSCSRPRAELLMRRHSIR